MNNLAQLAYLILYTAWTLLFIRLCCARSTLSPLASLRFAALGMLINPVLVLSLHRILNPYEDGSLTSSTNFNLLLSALTLALIASPALYYLLRRGALSMLSVADAFLMGFCLGLGFDLLGLLGTTSLGQQPTSTMHLFPPWVSQPVDGGFTWVGTSYRIGLILLVTSAGTRFLRNRLATVALCVATVVLMALEMEAWHWSEQLTGLLGTTRSTLAFVTIDGMLTPWFILTALVALSWREDAWVSRVPGLEDRSIRFIHEWHQIGVGGMAGLRRNLDGIGLTRQLELSKAELNHRPDDERLKRIVSHVQDRLRVVKDDTPKESDNRDQDSARPPSWSGRVFMVLPWLALLIALFNPSGVIRLFVLALVVILIWWYVTAPDWVVGFHLPDETFQLYAERSLYLLGLGAAILVLFEATTGLLYPIKAASFALRTQVDDPRLAEMILILLAFATAGLGLRHRKIWQTAPPLIRRRSAVRNAVTAFGALLIVWICIEMYTQGIVSLHAKYGAAFGLMASTPADTPTPEGLPFWADLVRFSMPPPFGNNIPAWFMTIVCLVTGYVGTRIVMTIRRRIDESFAQARRLG